MQHASIHLRAHALLCAALHLLGRPQHAASTLCARDRLQVCAITKPWVGTPPAKAYTGLGWQSTGRYSASGT